MAAHVSRPVSCVPISLCLIEVQLRLWWTDAPFDHLEGFIENASPFPKWSLQRTFQVFQRIKPSATSAETSNSKLTLLWLHPCQMHGDYRTRCYHNCVQNLYQTLTLVLLENICYNKHSNRIVPNIFLAPTKTSQPPRYVILCPEIRYQDVAAAMVLVAILTRSWIPR